MKNNNLNKIFIIGLPRTGTTSASVALLNHGFKVAHTAYTKHAFELADVISDAPCFNDYKELDALFPNSKFVYLHRDVKKWIPSMQMLLTKMIPQLAPKTGYLHNILKRCIYQVFELSTTENPLHENHLEKCFNHHKEQVFNYFENRDDLLTLDISVDNSLSKLLHFLDMPLENHIQFPHTNIGKRVDSWKEHKHPNKINSMAAGKEHRKFFEYHSRYINI